MVVPGAGGMVKISAATGIPHVDSDSNAFLEATIRIVVDINRQVLPTLTTPLDVAVRRVILHATAPSRTCAVVAVTAVATVSMARRGTIQTIRRNDSARPVGVVVKMATTLTSVTIRPCISRMDRRRGATIGMDQWKIGAGFATRKMRTCLLIAQTNCHRAIRCTRLCLHCRCNKGNSMETWVVCRIRIRYWAWRLV